MTDSEVKKLSLGCGRQKEEGFIGLDKYNYGHNKVWNAEKEELPFLPSSIDYIKAENFFEHLDSNTVIKTLNECWRILKPEGILEFNVPDVNYPEIAWSDPTHKSAWTKSTITKYLTGERPRNADYNIYPWKVIECKVDPKDKRVIRALLKPKKNR